MTKPSSKTIELAGNLRKDLAGPILPRIYAKLYSQYTRLNANRPSLNSWQEAEALNCLEDAIQLLDAAFIERDAGQEDWRNSARRTGELLEWLSHPLLNPDGLPLRLLSAAVYQLAGYPARSSGLLNDDISEPEESYILRALLKAEFPTLLKQLAQYWAENISLEEQIEAKAALPWQDSQLLSDELQKRIVKETASCLGILCAEIRWGDNDRLQLALNKLKDIGKLLLHGNDHYSWLLGRLCAEVAAIYANSSMRSHMQELYWGMNDEGKLALERYLRQCYRDNKALAWPSQVRGIQQLILEGSFALCTPTGSGKTTVAEIAILQSLFYEPIPRESAPLALYLVPSRALATEVEAKLAKILTPLNEPPIIVTGLYGGTDWGPTDVWLTTEQPTILICTYEKAEALIRFLGPLFLPRVSLIIIDEAHLIQFTSTDKTKLRNAESRALRLESLGTRLFTYLDRSRSKVIALSAMASGMETALAHWITGQTDALPAKTSYRSTRQLIGRLECLPGRGFRIYYDLLDGANLELQYEQGSQADTPYIANPFSSYPPATKWENKNADKPEKRLRPYLFWAAMQLASPDDKGHQRAVLISITQQISGYAEDLLSLLNSDWKSSQLPTFFQQPTDAKKREKWEHCLLACEDYFGRGSREYRMLEKGIVVHHGKMPGLMARFLVEVIQERIVHLVLATSTLSDGVNLPFETILIPTLRRIRDSLDVPEFGNLVGRAGRPGFGTEGRSLVLMEPEPTLGRNIYEAKQIYEARDRYFYLIDKLATNEKIDETADPRSPLAELLMHLEEQWQKISNSTNQAEFLQWLEQTAPLQASDDLTEEKGLYAIEALDSLDGLLLSVIVELEQLGNETLSADELEKRLQQLWQRSYAFYASAVETDLNNIFVHRGIALLTHVYPNASERRQLYRTSLPPRSGNQLLRLYPQIIDLLKSGEDYASRSEEKRYEYIQSIVDLMKSLPNVGIKEQLRNTPWTVILRWWLTSQTTTKLPADISTWHNFVSSNFVYRFNWGLGSVVSLALDATNDGKLFEPSFENWSQTGLPWIVLWLKELITWGTLEPVAAYLLARGIEVTRARAEKLAGLYYEEFAKDLPPNDRLNATYIREWAALIVQRNQSSARTRPPIQMSVNLLRDFSHVKNQLWKVLPVEKGNDIYWFDPAGYPLAASPIPEGWQPDYLDQYDFTLNSLEEIVSSRPYI